MSNSFFFLLLVQFFSLLHNSYAKPQSSLSKHFSQRVEHHDQPFLVSQDQNFSCGFYSAGTNAFVFSIWFTNSINKTIVWTANRDSPVNGHGSEMSFRHGNLVLKNVNGSTVWSTSLTSSGESAISLLNTGNLVIKSHDITIWQSFDTPTDTLLPNQPLSKGTKVISALERGGISSGYYWCLFDNDNVLKLIYDGPEISSIYWPDPSAPNVFAAGRTYYNSTRLAVLYETGNLISSDGLSVFASDFGPGIRRRLTVDYDGNLRIYSLNTSDGTWEVTWEAMQQLCNVHGLCGHNAICEYSPGLMCSCLSGHKMNDPSNWNRGCRPTYSFSCNPTESRFVEVPQVDFYGFDLGYTKGISFHDCKLLCLRNCTCTGFSYRLDGEGVCYPKGTLFNGNKVSSFPGNFYLRLPTDLNNSILDTPGLNCTNSSSEIIIGSSSTFDTSRNGPQWTYVFVFAAVLGALEIILVVIGWWYLFKDTDVPKSVEEGYKMISSQFRRFTYRELKEVTGKFKEEIGRGFSGIVYRGVLDDKRVVAVKKLTDVTQGEDEFWAEVSVIGKINHMNLVRMFGFCSESRQYLVVYEYIKNRSLDKHLFESNMTLQWRERLKIALGTAKGLAYLHHECLEWIIHCDVKPENILLTSDFEPKIADFGLAKLLKRDGPDFNFSHMRGTIGYMAPEWALSLPITSKVDVYSYGVVLLEIVTGSRVSGGILNDGQEMSVRNFADAVKQVLACGDESAITGLVDVRLQGQIDLEQAATMLRVAMTCLEKEGNQRPTMDEVVKHLSVLAE